MTHVARNGVETQTFAIETRWAQDPCVREKTKIHARASQPPFAGFATTRPWPRTCSRRQDEEDRLLFSRLIHPTAETRRTGCGHCAGCAASVRVIEGTQGTAGGIWSRDQSWDAVDFPASRCVPSLRGCFHGDSDVHEDETRRHRLRCRFYTWSRTMSLDDKRTAASDESWSDSKQPLCVEEHA